MVHRRGDDDEQFSNNKPRNCRPQGQLYDRLYSLMKHEVTPDIPYRYHNTDKIVTTNATSAGTKVCIETGLKYFEYLQWVSLG